MSEELQEIQERTESALSKGTFSLRDALNHRSYPTSKVKVYLDVENIHRLGKVNERLEELAQSRDQHREEFDKREKQAETLKEQILKSGLTFHLRGISSGEVEKITKEAREWAKGQDLAEDAQETTDYYMQALLAKHIVKVEDAQGQFDEHQYTVEEISALEEVLPGEQYTLLVRGFTALTFETAYFNSAVDAGFLPTS